MRDIALIGKGYWGKNLARNINDLGRLAMIVDGRPEILKQSREEYPEVICEENLQAALSSEKIKAVFIATPAPSHTEIALSCLRAGKDVFIEKPMCMTPEEGELLKAAVEETGQIIMVGHILLFHPCVRKLKEMITGGELGKIKYIYSNRLNFGKIRTEENIFWSFAPHDISVINYLLGSFPLQVSAHAKDDITAKVHDTTLSSLEYPGDSKAHIFVSWLHPYKEQRLVIMGDKGMVVFSDTDPDKLVLYPHKVDWVNMTPVANKADGQVVEYEEWEPLRKECEHFLECIDNRTSPLTDVQNGLDVVKVLDASDLSIANNGVPVVLKGAAKPAYHVHESAVVDDGAMVGDGTKIWHYSHVSSGATIGKNCNFGQNVFIAGGVRMGDRVKVQNNVSIYGGTDIEDEVFLGPSCVLTNVTNPRSQVNRQSLYETTTIRRGASVGANATIVCGIEIGKYAFIAAGAVVAQDVPNYALMVGVPARQKGYMSRHGLPLDNPDSEGVMTCPESGLRYKEVEGVVKCLDLDEDAPLPETLASGTKSYDSFKD